MSTLEEQGACRKQVCDPHIKDKSETTYCYINRALCIDAKLTIRPTSATTQGLTPD